MGSMQSDCACRAELRNAATAALAATTLAACSPTLNWREARPEGSGAIVMFPCRPQQQQRDVTLAGSVVAMRMNACSAGGANFAVATLDAGDPRRVTPELAALRSQLLVNLSAASAEQRPLAVAGATPNPESVRLHAVGKRPDGSRVVADGAFFVKGLTLYQATVLAGDDGPGREAVDTFFGAIRLP
jgi:hypothetical protein